MTFEPALEPSRREWFVRRHGDCDRARGRGAATATRPLTPRIRYPAADTVIALDPDIPIASQRVAFVAAPASAGLRWRLDDDRSAGPGGRMLWTPTFGRHRLALEDGRGNVLSTVEFEVRGMRARRTFRRHASR